MIMVFAMMATLWGIGIAMDAPKQARWTMIGLLLVAVLMIQIALPDGHSLREATGGDARLWLLLIAFGAVAMGYRWILLRLREKAMPEQDKELARQSGLSPTELERYARHIVLREIGGPGQMRLAKSKVLVVGAGGLGSPALQYLAAAGVGTIGVIDDDVVENANLQRQVIHRDAQIGAPKVQSAADAMRAQNPFVNVQTYHRRLDDKIANDLIAEYDLVLDGSDNFETRYLVNRAAVTASKPLIAAALTQWEGQIAVYDPAGGGPCYACLFPTAPDRDLVPSCAEAGVLGPLPGVVGAMMAVEAIKLLTDAGSPLRGRIMIYDALYAETRVIEAGRRPDCAVCAAHEISLKGEMP